VLAALQVDLGWDARNAEILVGTSAGAVTAAMLRMDTSPFDLASCWRPRIRREV
jgi:NTE family protein